MMAMNSTWNRLTRLTREVLTLPQRGALESRRDAQDVNRTAESFEQHTGGTNLAGLRIQKWPQFFVLWQIIGGVSAYDAFLAMKYREELCIMEKNSLGRLLLFANDGDPALFLGVKFLGTVIVLGILANLYHSHPQRGMAIAKGVAAFQMVLLAYLTL
jgi:hypothetical protein